ncbi:hypothetical protein ATI61_107413 [Archangium gephyra]|uniref:Lipoprotein n=1 Tax=Archangium gephyra TaxID=48 RepID=A0AAC8QI73_9BACT|nr:hypothetical protein [Archangium gephyra]AKJ07973.1 Hypothetical protein AA314_09599 [Archangium gephyra]REG29717.1 hypothetical protein ATI61_107413 [Archangium gephyra]
MRPMRPLLCVALVSLGLLSACALRPYYRQVLPPDLSAMKPAAVQGKGEVVRLRVVEPETERPIPGARIFLSTNRGRVSLVSDMEGLVQMPLTPELLAENPLVEVVPPAGVSGYAFQPVKQEPASAPAGESARPSQD